MYAFALPYIHVHVHIQYSLQYLSTVCLWKHSHVCLSLSLSGQSSTGGYTVYVGLDLDSGIEHMYMYSTCYNTACECMCWSACGQRGLLFQCMGIEIWLQL